MEEKLAIKRWNGRGGWYDEDRCRLEYLEQDLMHHMEKTVKMRRLTPMDGGEEFRGYRPDDLVDIANLAMMMWNRLNELEPENQMGVKP